VPSLSSRFGFHEKMRLRLNGDVVPKWVKRAKHMAIPKVQPRPNLKSVAEVAVTFTSIFNLLTTVHGDMVSSGGPLAPVPTVLGV